MNQQNNMEAQMDETARKEYTMQKEEAVNAGRKRGITVRIPEFGEGDCHRCMHHLFDRTQPFQAKLWVGDSFIYNHQHQPTTPPTTPDSNNPMTGTTGLGGYGVGTAVITPGDIVFAVEIICGSASVPDGTGSTTSVDVSGCVGAAVVAGLIADGYTVTEYADTSDQTSGGDVLQAMGVVLKGILAEIETKDNPLKKGVSINNPVEKTITTSENSSATTSTIIINGVGTFTVHSLHEDHNNLKPCEEP